MFHCLAHTCADVLVGGLNADRSKPAWRQVYRSLEHGPAKDRCSKQDMLRKFPKDVEDFANTFVSMQIKRHSADYDPLSQFYKSEVQQDIVDAESVMLRFRRVPIKDRRAFAAYVLFKRRG